MRFLSLYTNTFHFSKTIVYLISDTSGANGLCLSAKLLNFMRLSIIKYWRSRKVKFWNTSNMCMKINMKGHPPNMWIFSSRERFTNRHAHSYIRSGYLHIWARCQYSVLDSWDLLEILQQRVGEGRALHHQYWEYNRRNHI